MKLDRTLNYFVMIKKCVRTTANPYFYDRCEKKKETKNEIFFFSQKNIHLEEFENKFRVDYIF